MQLKCYMLKNHENFSQLLKITSTGVYGIKMESLAQRHPRDKWSLHYDIL